MSKLIRVKSWGFGAVLRDNNGCIMTTATRGWNQQLDPRTAEVMSFKVGLELACDLCFLDVEAETDCLDVTKALSKQVSDNTLFHLLILDNLSCMGDFRSCHVDHIGRDGNKVAHELAKLASSFLDYVWIEDVPQTICNATMFDLLACPA